MRPLLPCVDPKFYKFARHAWRGGILPGYISEAFQPWNRCRFAGADTSVTACKENTTRILLRNWKAIP